MQTIELKNNIISWVTELNDKSLINELYVWIQSRKKEKVATKGVVPPRRKGSLTEGYGFWADDAPFNETDYRDKLWQPERNAW